MPSKTTQIHRWTNKISSATSPTLGIHIIEFIPERYSFPLCIKNSLTSSLWTSSRLLASNKPDTLEARVARLNGMLAAAAAPAPWDEHGKMVQTLAALYLCGTESALKLLEERNRADFDVDARFDDVVPQEAHLNNRRIAEQRPAEVPPFNQLHLCTDPVVLSWLDITILNAYLAAQQWLGGDEAE